MALENSIFDLVTKKRLSEASRAAFFVIVFVLSCVFYDSGFADHCEADSSRISQVSFNLFCDVLGKLFNFAVLNLFVVYKNTKLAACLNGVCFFNAVKAFCNCFEIFKSFNVIVDCFAAGTRAGCGNCIGNLNDCCFKSCCFNIVVVSGDGVYYARIFA